MVKYWKYALVAVLAFTIGTAMVASAAGIQRFVISDRYGMNTARILPGGRLVVDATRSIVGVKNFPDVQQVSGEVSVGNLPDVQPVEVMNPNLPDHSAIVNVTGGSVRHVDDPSPCLADSSFTVADGKTLLITDFEMYAYSLKPVLWTDARGIIRFVPTGGFQPKTPLGGKCGRDCVCLRVTEGVPGPPVHQYFFFAGQLVDAP